MAVKFRLDRQLKVMREWVAREENREIMFTDSIAKIQKKLGAAELGNLSEQIRSLTVWHGAVAGVRVLEAADDCWQELCLAYRYFSWYVRVSVKQFDVLKWKISGIPAERAALYVAHGIVTGEMAEVERILPRFFTSPKTGLFGAFWKLNPMPVFVRALVARWKNVCLEDEGVPLAGLGPYQAIFNAWDDHDRLRQAMSAACDEHVHDLRRSEIVFDPYPYNVFPVEILLVRRIRDDLGLHTPELEHPLVKTNKFMEVPAQPIAVQDDFLDEIVPRIQELMPGV